MNTPSIHFQRNEKLEMIVDKTFHQTYEGYEVTK